MYKRVLNAMSNCIKIIAVESNKKQIRTSNFGLKNSINPIRERDSPI
mgnify:CR=1 FL=1